MLMLVSKAPLSVIQEHFYSLDKTEIRRPPVMQLQVWDNDLFSLDDYLGELVEKENGRLKTRMKKMKRKHFEPLALRHSLITF